MIRLSRKGRALRVFSSKNEKIDFNKAKKILRQADRMINQSTTTSIIIEVDDATKFDRRALILVEKMLYKLNNLSIVWIRA